MQLFTANSFNDEDCVDKLVYSYAPKSNQLQNVMDQADEHASRITSGGLEDVYTAGNKYIYGDLNGNTTRDHNKNMKYIHYKHLNLPTLVMFNSGDRIIYTYDALGTKLAKQVMVGTASSFTYYAGAFIYEKSANVENLAFFSQPEGNVEKNGSSFSYVYQHKDHLGNVRLSYKNTSTTGIALQIVEENNYYPFGLKHKGYNNTPIAGQRDHKYGFGGKEEQNELGLEWIDITARNYDPALGRWMNVDPLAEFMRSQSVYNFTFNNPVSLVDDDGMTPEKPDKIITKVTSSKKTSHSKVQREMTIRMTLTVVNMTGSDLSTTMFKNGKGNVNLKNFQGWGESYTPGAGQSNRGIDSSQDKITNFEIDYIVVNSINDIREGDDILLIVDEIINTEKPVSGLNDGRVSAVESNTIASGTFDEVAQHESAGHGAGASHTKGGLMNEEVNNSTSVSKKTRGEIAFEQTGYNGVGTYDSSKGNIQYENTTAKQESQKFIDKYVKIN